MTIPAIPESVAWRNGLVLEPLHFQRSDRRAALLSHLSALVADPWPWGFTNVRMDEVSLSSFQLRIDCEGIFPNGEPFRQAGLVHSLARGATTAIRRPSISPASPKATGSYFGPATTRPPRPSCRWPA